MKHTHRIAGRSTAFALSVFSTLITLVLGIVTASASTDTTWVLLSGSSDGTTDWTNAANWSNGAPGAGYNVIFAGPVGTESANSTWPNGLSTLAMDKITFASGFSNSRTATMIGWNVSVSGTFIEVQSGNSGNQGIALSQGGSNRSLTLQSGTSTILNNGSGSLQISSSNFGILQNGNGSNSTLVADGSGLTTIAGTGIGEFHLADNGGGGNLSLIKNGSGTLILGGSNTHSGGTTLNAGTLTLGNGIALGAGTLTINGGSIDSSVANLVNSQNNLQNWNGDFSFVGTNSLNLGTGSVVMNASRQVTVSAKTLTVGGGISGSGYGLTKTGSGTLVLSGNNTYDGPTTITTGTLQLNGVIAAASTMTVGSAGSLSGSGTINGNLNFSSASASTFQGTIAGSGSMVLNSSTSTGILTLSGSNSYSGGTTVAGVGGLNLANSDAAGTGTIYLKTTQPSYPNTNLGISGGITVANHIQIDSTLGREAINSGGSGNNSLTGGIEFTGNGSSGSTIIANNQTSGTFTLSGGITGTSASSQLSLRGNATAAGVVNGAIVFPNLQLGNNGATNWTLNTVGSNYSYIYVQSSGNFNLAASDAIATNARLDFNTNTCTGAVNLNGFNQTLTGITTSAAPFTGNGGIVVNNGSADSILTLAGLTASLNYLGTITDGTTNRISLVLNNGNGYVQTLSGSDSYTGSTTLRSGTLQANHPNALGNGGNITFTGGALQYTGSSAAQDWSTRFKGSTSAITIDTNNQNVTLAGVIDSTNTGGLIKSGSGNLILNGINTFTGNTSINVGVVVLGNNSPLGTGTVTVSSGAALQLQSGSGITVANALNLTGSGINNDGALRNISGSNTYSGAVTLSSNSRINSDAGTLYLTSGSLALGSYTLTVGGAGNTTFAGILSGSGGLTKDGAGTVLLTNSNSFTGTTIVSSGTLSIGDGTTGHDGSIASSSGISLVNPAASLLYNLSSGASRTYSNSIIGQGSLTLMGQGALALTGSNSYSGGTILNQGTLTLGNSNALGTGTLTFNGGTLDTSVSNLVNSQNNAQNWNADFTFAGASSLNLGTGPVVMNASRQVTVSANTLTVGGSISGTGYGLTKMGTGALALTGSNTYSGGTMLTLGTLILGNSSALGTGTLTFNGGTLDSSVANLVNSQNNAQNWNADFTFAGTNSLNLGTGPVVMNASRQVTVSANKLTVGGPISGSGYGLTKTGTGTLALSGSNSYSGGTTISAGTLQMGNAYAFGGNGSNITIASGATLDTAGVSGTSAARYNLTLSGSGVSGAGAITNSSGTGNLYLASGTLAGDTLISAQGTFLDINASSGISGTSYTLTADDVSSIRITGSTNVANLIKNGVGSLELNGTCTIAGAANINNGMLIVRNTLGSGTIYLGNTTGTNTTTLQFAGSSNWTNPIIVQSGNSGTAIIDNYTNWGPTLSGTITLNNNLTLRNNTTTGAGSIWVGGVITGTGGLTILQSGTVTAPITLSGSNTFSGNTTMSSTSYGTLNLANVNALKNSTLDTGNVGIQSVGFTVTGTNTYNIGGLQGAQNLTVGYNSISVGSNNANTTYSGGISGSNGGFIKTGTGTLTLSGSNAYTGATAINAGKVIVSGSLNGTTSVTVANGAELNVTGLVNPAASLTLNGALSGNGSVGLVTANSGSVLSPESAGNLVGAATLTAGALTLHSGGIYQLELGTDGSTGAAGTDWDKLTVSGALDLASLSSGSRFVLKLSTLSGINTLGALGVFDAASNHTWSSVVGFGSLTGSFNSNLFTLDTTGFANSLQGGSFQLVRNGSNLDLQFLAVPEPSTFLMILFGMGMLALMSRHRRILN